MIKNYQKNQFYSATVDSIRNTKTKGKNFSHVPRWTIIFRTPLLVKIASTPVSGELNGTFWETWFSCAKWTDPNRPFFLLKSNTQQLQQIMRNFSFFARQDAAGVFSSFLSLLELFRKTVSPKTHNFLASPRSGLIVAWVVWEREGAFALVSRSFCGGFGKSFASNRQHRLPVLVECRTKQDWANICLGGWCFFVFL